MLQHCQNLLHNVTLFNHFTFFFHFIYIVNILKNCYLSILQVGHFHNKKKSLAILLQLCFPESGKWEVLDHWHYLCCSYFYLFKYLNKRSKWKQIYLNKEIRLSKIKKKSIFQWLILSYKVCYSNDISHSLLF